MWNLILLRETASRKKWTLEHSKKIYGKILEKKPRRMMRIDKCHIGFCLGRLACEAMYTMRGLQEKVCEEEIVMFLLTYVRPLVVLREIIRWASRKQRVPQRFVVLVMGLLEGVKLRMKQWWGNIR